MREIKFRVWNKVNKTVHEHITHPDNWSFGYLNQDVFTWSQFIGIKDKNDKEIYEDDFVKVRYKGGEEGIYEVAWNQEHCCFMMGRMLEDDADTVYFGNQFEWEYEVVGNTYETPELKNQSSIKI